MNPYPVISSDSHVIEPPDLWQDRVEAKYKDRAPKIVHGPDKDVWVCDNATLLPIGGSAGAGKTNQELQELRALARFEKCTPRGGYIARERLKEMAVDGVSAEVIYPTTTLRLYSLKDLDFQAALFDAYNRWLAEYCSVYPNRIKGIALVSLRNVEQAVGELHRAKELGMAGAMIGISPEDEREYGQPTIDPFWRTAQDLDLPISLHILTEKKPVQTRGIGEAISDSVYVQRTLATMISMGVFDRFPQLRIVSAESDAGWGTYFMERLDYAYAKRKELYKLPDLARKPSEYFKSNVWLTFMRDRSGVRARHEIGVGQLMWSSDYPHQDSTWPRSQQTLDYLFEGVSQADRRKITYENARDFYHFEGLTPLKG